MGKSFDDEIKGMDHVFVLFYASWCPFSQDFLPIFEDYAKSNPKECLSIVIDDRPDLCEKYSIRCYPTVILFKKGKAFKRLDAGHGIGLTAKQLKSLTSEQ